MSLRKPYNDNAGYVASLKARIGGHIVIYDARKMEIDSDHRWVVMHEPSSLHVSVSNLPLARDLMKSAARAATPDESDADILPRRAEDN
jgi:hypothetical protein